jgi:RNA polymerase sigma-70 factor (ECF subfamily)
MHVRRRRDLAGLPAGLDPPDTLDAIGRSDTVLAVRWALQQLPEDFRAALVLRGYADLSYAEIADVQGVPENTVRSRIARARRALVQLLTESTGVAQ